VKIPGGLRAAILSLVRNHPDLRSPDFRNPFPGREGIAGELKRTEKRCKLTALEAEHIIFDSPSRIFAHSRLSGWQAGSGPMDKKKMDAFKKRLEERQRELRRNVSRTAQDGREADLESAQDIADRAANSYTKEFLFSQSSSERQILGMVENALTRIREGTFGECIACGEEINPKRLEAVPWTRHCIACQEKLEQGLLEATGT
jgi:DnaK suppressor protein